MSTNNPPKSKRERFRGWLRRHLPVSSSRSLSAPSPQPTSESHVSIASEPANDARVTAPGRQNVPSAANETRPQVDDSAEKLEPMTGAWAGLRVSLKTLRDTPAMFPPLVSAASVLLDCFDTIEATARNQQDYEDLAAELNALSKSLVENYKGAVSSSASGCVIGIANGIERQAKEIEKKTERGTGRRMIMAAADEEDLMRRYRRIQSLFRQLQTNLSMGILSNTNELVVNSRLGGLNPEKQATYNSKLSASTNRRTCTEGTRTQVLSELKGWVFQMDGHAVYWMSGMAGTGKTTIACTFAKWLEQEKLLAASFFCTRTLADCRDVTRIIPTVAYQLARYSIPFQSALCDVLGSDPDIGAKDLKTQFKHLLIDPLQKVKNDILDNLVVVIDALDECDDQSGVGTILDLLLKHASQLPVRFFVTSRPEVEIYSRMKDNAECRAAIYLHDIEKSLVKADIGLYLREELAFMGSGLSDNDLQELIERSGALFIYAATLVRYIRPATRKANSKQRLRSVLGMTADAGGENSQIDALYTAVLKSALDEEDLEESEKKDTRAVLRAVLFSQEPVPVETIAELSGIEGSDRVESALNALRSVLHHSEITGLVSTLHASFPDFMFNKARSGAYHCDVGEHGATLRDRCFLVMRTQLRFNICDLPSSFVPDDRVEDMQDRIKSKISLPLSYACRYWANHLTMSTTSRDAVAGLSEFLSNQLLFWMEVMSVKRELLAGIEALLRIKRWLAGCVSMPSELALLAEDAATFYTNYATSSASQSTSHIYISSLPFCPRSSSVYTHYWPRMQGLLDLRGSLMEQRSTAALATWKIGSPVNSVAYSPDGSRVAVGCNDGSVSIRNAYDGTLLAGPLQGHTHWVRSVVFSGDGRLVASGSHDGTIRVWDVRSGSLVAGPFQGHTNYVNSVSFSPDSTRIVSGSSDRTIRVWRATDGALLLGPLHGHTSCVNCVTYSPDGTLIASASWDKTIRLWHSHDGTPTASPLHGHTDAVNCVAFTPDGTRLVSASNDHTVGVWRVSDGLAVTSPFQGHTNWVTSVAVSGDGTLVASGSYDDTVRVWRLDDGTPAAGPFAGHTHYIQSVVYAPDGTRVISGSDDGTMRAWNVREGLVPAASERPPLSKLNRLCFSSDGAHVVTESDDNGIQMWSVADGTCQPGPVDMRPLSPPSQNSSPDGLYTAETDAYGRLVQVIRAADGAAVAGPFDGTPRVWVFSDDSASVMVGFSDGRIEVVDLPSGRAALHLRSADYDVVRMIAQSPDRSLLASIDYARFSSQTLRIWSMLGPTLVLESAVNPPLTPAPVQISSCVYDNCHIEDGWLVNNSDDMILWLPSEIAGTGLSPFASLIITAEEVLQVPMQKLLVGSRWKECYVQS